MIIIGDFKVDVSKTSNKANRCLDVLANGFEIMNDLNKPTRVDKQYTTHSIIGNVVSNITILITITLTDDPMSDHKVMNKHVQHISRSTTTLIQKYSRQCLQDISKVKTAIQKQLQDLMQNLTFDKLLNTIDKETVHARIKPRHAAKNVNEGWFTSDINNLIKKRNKYYILTKNFPDNSSVKKI